MSKANMKNRNLSDVSDKRITTSLRKAYEKGFIEDKDELPLCFGGIRRYETFYNCDECPLNQHCELLSFF